MDTVTIHVAKTTLSQLIARVEAGEEIVIARGKEQVAKLVAYAVSQPKRRAGAFKGQFTVGPEFFEPMSDDDLAAWE
jgi:antitoxin (DNA-binding transcriptional repressor) of toxin-antitoxin stability system